MQAVRRGMALAGTVTAVVVMGASAESTAEPARAAHVVVVGVAGLRWDDVTLDGTPHLAEMARTGSVGTLSVRSAPSVTCPAEGWLTLGAGTYAAVRPPGEIDPADGCAARPLPPVVADGTGGSVVRALPAIDMLNRELRFGARAGWLSRRVDCVAAVGPGAALAAADADGGLAHYDERLPDDVEGTLSACPATVVDLGVLAGGPGRAAAVAQADRSIGEVRAALPPAAVLMVLGVAETQPDQPRLHAAVVTGPGFGPGYLQSASTRRVPYVQLCDVAPTIAHALGEPVPDVVAGRPFSGGHPGRPAGLVPTLEQLVDADDRAVAQRAVLGPFFVLFGTTIGLALVGLTWLLVRRQLVGVRTAAVVLSCVPTATFLANLVPWWGTSTPLLVLSVSVVAMTGVIAGMALVVARLPMPFLPPKPGLGHGFRGQERRRLSAVAVLTVLVFAGDAATGANLQLASMLGYNPLVAGRFVGFGNIAFAVFGTAAVMFGAFAASGRAPRAAVVAVAVVAVPVVALDGLPAWGADFGGVLALVPTFGVLALLTAGSTVSWRRLLVAQAVGATVVGLVGWLDYLRPADERSHFGRFVGSVLDGRALATIERKWLTSWELLFMGPHTMAALALTVGLVVLVLRPPALLRLAYRDHAVLRPMLYSIVALALVGSLLNDSGVAVPAVIALVAVPATLALCAESLTRPLLTE